MIFPLILTLAAICQVAPASPGEDVHTIEQDVKMNFVFNRFLDCVKEGLDDYKRVVLKQDIDFIPISGPSADNAIVRDSSLKLVGTRVGKKSIERVSLHPFWGRREYQQQALEEKPRTALNLLNISPRAIFLNDTKVSWNEARNKCLDKKAQLAIIDSADTENFLINFMKKHNVIRAWIGVHSLFGDKQWTTVKGDKLESLPYVHWGKHQPDNYGGNERCVVLNQRGMNDLACDSEAEYICQ